MPISRPDLVNLVNLAINITSQPVITWMVGWLDGWMESLKLENVLLDPHFVIINKGCFCLNRHGQIRFRICLP